MSLLQALSEVGCRTGSLINHSTQPNLDYRVDTEALVIFFFAACPIAAGQELTIFYGSKLWFVDSMAKPNNETLHDHMDCADTFLAAVEL